MQQLFFAMEMGRSEVGLEQWQFRIEGLLETTLLRQAVELVVERHAILRTAFVDAGAKRGLQVVCERAELPWFEQDWRPLSKSEQDAALASLMRTDSSQVFDLSRPPALRMTLCRTEEREWVLLWSTHHLCIDGWSWSLVLQDVSHAYSALIAGGTPEWPATIPYRTYVDWLTHSSPNSEAFWRQELASIAGPTPLRLTAVEASEDTRRELTVQLDKESGESLHRIARDQKTTLNVLLTAAWAVALSHYSGSTTVLMGAAFSGRPAELAGIDTMVGPCVNNLPVRADVVDSETLPTLFRRLQERQFDLAQNQYSSLEQIQQWSSVPWRHRLFDSLIVFQNYQVDPQAGRIGQSAEVTLLAAPEATNYPLTLAITVVTGLRIRLIRQPELLAFADIEQFATDLVALLRQIARDPFSTVATLRAVLAPDLKAKAAALAHANPTPARQPFAAAGNDMEELVAQVWAELFSVERISVDENFFELGGHSMLLIRAHSRLCERLGTDLPVVALLQYPTIRSLARHLGGASARELHTVDTAIERARRQREARARQRALSVRV
jgi:acyl carrier protein